MHHTRQHSHKRKHVQHMADLKKEKAGLSSLVHSRSRCEIVGRLGAAVQHHDERNRLTGTIAARDVEPVTAAACIVGEPAPNELSAIGEGYRTGPRNTRLFRADQVLQRYLAQPTARCLGFPGRGMERGRAPAFGDPVDGRGTTRILGDVGQGPCRLASKSALDDRRRSAPSVITG